MRTAIVVRGKTVQFSTTIYDLAGTVADPSDVTLYIRYPRGGSFETNEISMTKSGDTWSAIWSSVVSDAGRASWSIRSIFPDAAEDGFLRITANSANPEPSTGT
jgi:hypothetical protein